VQFDLRTLAANGFGAVVDGWITTIEAATEDKDYKSDPFDHKLVPALVPTFLDRLANAEARRAELDAQVKAATTTTDDEDESEDTDQLSPAELAKLKKELTATKKHHKVLQERLLTELEAERRELGAERETNLVLDRVRNQITSEVDSKVTTHRRLIVAALEVWWEKYAMSLREIEHERDAATARLNTFLKELDYE
jgi:type I restriction enzyme M protein